jgi:2-polyprenyl-6-methoxyphenol hydroxylase-like FAD-dependent oxidoreductase
VRTDVAVVGSGPAGATAARLLQEWGHRVVLLTRPAGPRPPLAESLPPSTRKLLAAVGVLPAVEAAAFVVSTGNTSWWGSGAARVESFGGAPGATGWQVVRADLEAVLRRAAAASGVRVREEARVRTAAVDVSDAEEVRLVIDEAGGPAEALHAGYVIDASGRAGVVARRGWRTRDDAVTVAVSAVWRREGGFAVPDDTHTIVESHRDGWVWSVPVAPGVRHVTAMADARAWPTAAGRRLGTVYAGELAKAPRLSEILADATQAGPPWAADASTYAARTFAAGRVLLAGDAASFIDPLSSYGVKKALASGWLAAVAVNTALRHPDRAATALAFHDQRERRMHARYAGEAAGFAAQAAAVWPDSAFWRSRSQPPAGPIGRGDEDDLASDADVRAAFETLKSRSRLHLSPAPAVRALPRPAVVGAEIDERPALVRGDGEAVHFACGVSAAYLADIARGADEVPELWRAYNDGAAARGLPPVALPDFLRGLSTLLAAGYLRDA